MNPANNVCDALGRELAAIDPASEVTEADLARSRARSLAFAGTEGSLGTGSRALKKRDARVSSLALRRQPVPVRRRVVLAAAAAVLLVGGIVTADVILPGYSGASAEAAQALHSAASASIKTSDPVVGPGQYLKVATTAVSSGGVAQQGGTSAAWLDKTTGEVYVPADRSQEWVWNRGARVPTQFFSASAEAAWKEIEKKVSGSPGFKAEIVRADGGAFYGGPQNVINGMSLDEIPTIPRDPKELLKLIYDRTVGAGPSAEIEAVVTIADTLRTGIVPADLRAALYEAAALIPGVTLTEQQATLDGRTGVAIGIEGPFGGGRQDIIIDPDTGLMIGERKIALKATDVFPAGTATEWTSIRTSVVDSAP
ncbi:CU044_5270 family protein [Arthrobacter sp. NPDC093139]|uniref:CU044_5270 family protein n=1 Tax=Arthrobacter sp. NPDC093139 TaxID=3363945 RepID=UPI00381DD305